MICATVPQPCEGRCWNSPMESRSPWSRLRNPDSCKAVAKAIDTARGGSPRWTATPAMIAALYACSRSSWAVWPPTLATHPSCGDGKIAVPWPSHQRTASPATSAITNPMIANPTRLTASRRRA